MSSADFVVVEIMRWRDLHAAGTELSIHVVVGDDGNAAIRQRQRHLGTNQGGKALVFWMNGHSGVAKHGFRARCGDHQMVLAVRRLSTDQRVAQMPQVPGLFAVFHFQIGDGSLQFRVPIHQTLAAVDQAVFIEPHEYFDDGAGKPLVHGEPFALPIHGRTHAPNLLRDVAAGFLLPLPYLVDEGVAANVLQGNALRRQLTFHHHLRGDLRVVDAGLPERAAAIHALIANQRIHQRVLEGMADV